MEHPVSTERRPLSQWHRSGPERRLAGVCMALARELDIPLPAVRAAFVLAVALPGIRVLAGGLYLALWFVTPPELDEPSALDRFVIAIEDLFSARRGERSEERRETID
jgi:phage shock protein PspC (stress-responsive transcriptional regulator)